MTPDLTDAGATDVQFRKPWIAGCLGRHHGRLSSGGSYFWCIAPLGSVIGPVWCVACKITQPRRNATKHNTAYNIEALPCLRLLFCTYVKNGSSHRAQTGKTEPSRRPFQLNFEINRGRSTSPRLAVSENPPRRSPQRSGAAQSDPRPGKKRPQSRGK